MTARVFIILTLISGAFIFSPSHAEPISSHELIGDARIYDGKTVVYRGEIVGDIMRRPSYAWLNVNDGNNAIGVWAQLSMTQNLFYAGGYQVKGDQIEVTGIFHRACPEHGGDLDIHALKISLITPGHKKSHTLDNTKLITAALLIAILVLVWILNKLGKR